MSWLYGLGEGLKAASNTPLVYQDLKRQEFEKALKQAAAQRDERQVALQERQAVAEEALKKAQSQAAIEAAQADLLGNAPDKARVSPTIASGLAPRIKELYLQEKAPHLGTSRTFTPTGIEPGDAEATSPYFEVKPPMTPAMRVAEDRNELSAAAQAQRQAQFDERMTQAEKALALREQNLNQNYQLRLQNTQNLMDRFFIQQDYAKAKQELDRAKAQLDLNDRAGKAARKEVSGDINLLGAAPDVLESAYQKALQRQLANLSSQGVSILPQGAVMPTPSHVTAPQAEVTWVRDPATGKLIKR